MAYKNAYKLLKWTQKVPNYFESKIFQIGKQTQRKGFKTLTPKQMLQGLLIALTQRKADNILRTTTK